jgi:hypothetical protein
LERVTRLALITAGFTDAAVVRRNNTSVIAPGARRPRRGPPSTPTAPLYDPYAPSTCSPTASLWPTPCPSDPPFLHS